MILSYQLGAAMLTVDGITLDELPGVLDVLTRRGATPAPDDAIAKAFINGFLGVDHGDSYNGGAPEVVGVIPLNDGPLAQSPDEEEADPLDEIYGGPLDEVVSHPQERAAEAFRNGGHVERQHLDVPDLEDPDALARAAFDAFSTVHPEHKFGSWVLTYTKPGWRAAAAAVKTAASLQQLNRAAAEV